MSFWSKTALWTGAVILAEPVSKVVISGVETVGKVSTNEAQAYKRGFEEGYKSAISFVDKSQQRSSFRK